MKPGASAEQSEGTSPLVANMHDQIRPERPKYRGYYALSALDQIVFSHQGRRAALRFALAPGFHISRLWRFPIRAFGALIFRAFGALIFAPLAL
jgi:hypothetical protein